GVSLRRCSIAGTSPSVTCVGANAGDGDGTVVGVLVAGRTAALGTATICLGAPTAGRIVRLTSANTSLALTQPMIPSCVTTPIQPLSAVRCCALTTDPPGSTAITSAASDGARRSVIPGALVTLMLPTNAAIDVTGGVSEAVTGVDVLLGTGVSVAGVVAVLM